MVGSKTYCAADVAKHNKADDCWIIVDGAVYDVTKFLSEHPGGKKVIVQVAGQDASKKFHLFHKPSVMQKYGPGLEVGKVGAGGGGGEAPTVKPAAAADKTHPASTTAGAKGAAVGSGGGGAGKGEHPSPDAVSKVKKGDQPGADKTADGKSADSGKGQDSSKDSAKWKDADKAGQSDTRISSQEAEQKVKEQRAAQERKTQLSDSSDDHSSAPSTPKSSSSPPSPSNKKASPPSPSNKKSSGGGKPTSDKLFGELVPYGDPSWYQGWHTPYYKPHHHKFRAALREFMDKELAPNAHDWDEQKQVPKELFRKCFEAGFLPGVVGPPWPTEWVGEKLAGGLKANEFDTFTELIITDEISRIGSGGLAWGILGGLSIGLPPVMKFGSKMLQEKCCKQCLSGEKVICLAITEPYAGSDVANIQCEAKKSEDGKHYIVNGEKKCKHRSAASKHRSDSSCVSRYSPAPVSLLVSVSLGITNGVFADFFTVAVRTGGKGMGGISLLLIERQEGVTTKQMKCQGVWSSGTTYITFEDVKVPVDHLIGKENEGFKYIVRRPPHSNTQHVRSRTVPVAHSSRVLFAAVVRCTTSTTSVGVSVCKPRASLASVWRRPCATHSSAARLASCSSSIPSSASSSLTWPGRWKPLTRCWRASRIR